MRAGGCFASAAAASAQTHPASLDRSRSRQGFYQRCHDPECADFRGDMRPLDPGLKEEARAGRRATCRLVLCCCCCFRWTDTGRPLRSAVADTAPFLLCRRGSLTFLSGETWPRGRRRGDGRRYLSSCPTGPGRQTPLLVVEEAASAAVVAAAGSKQQLAACLLLRRLICKPVGAAGVPLLLQRRRRVGRRRRNSGGPSCQRAGTTAFHDDRFRTTCNHFLITSSAPSGDKGGPLTACSSRGPGTPRPGRLGF